MPDTYAIKDWDDTFENRRTREIASPDYVNWPTHQDSEGFLFLSRTENGTLALGVFGALVQFAAKQPLPRTGVLADERGPMTPERYSSKHGLPVSSARTAWSLLASADVGWLVLHTPCEARATGSAPAALVAPTITCRLPADAPPTECRPSADVPPMDWKGLEGIGLDGRGNAPSAVADSVPVGFGKFWEAWPKHERKTGKKKCLGIWRRMGLEKRADEMVKAVETWKKTDSWTKESGAYIPMPETWLNRGSYDEVPEKSSPAPGKPNFALGFD